LTKEDALREIQKMHKTKTVFRESIIGWYYFYSEKLPKMHPERSLADLIRTIDLWMRLTDRGGQPGFPYEYKCGIDLSGVKLDNPDKLNVVFPFYFILMIICLISVFVNFKLGLSLISLSILVSYIDYRVKGGYKNLNLYEKELSRVYEWVKSTKT